MGWRESRWKRLADAADDYRDQSVRSWLGGTVFVVIFGSLFAAGVLYVAALVFGGERDVLRWLAVGALTALSYACGRRFLGWRAHRKRARQPAETAES